MQPINASIRMRPIDPVVNNQSVPKKSASKDPLEGKTVYEAIHITANSTDDLKITHIKGKFPRDTTDNDVIIADSYEVNDKKYFKFILDWEVRVEGQTNPIKFTQAVFTTVEIPEKGTIQDLEYAEKKAYQLAKSYELIQKNIVKRPPNLKDEDYKKQVKTLKSENQISFKNDESIKTKHQFSHLKAESNQIPLFLSKEKTDKTSQKVFSRIDLIPSQKIILRQGSGVNVADFQNKEVRGVKAEPHDKAYKKHLKTQAKGYKERFDKLSQTAETQKARIGDIRKTDKFKNVKADYLKLVPESETQKNAEIASLYKESGLTDLQQTLEEMKKEQKIYENAHSLLHNVQLVSTKPIAQENDAEGQKLKDQIKSLEKAIDDLKLDILDPAKDLIVSIAQPQPQPVVQPQQQAGIEVDFEEVTVTSSDSSFEEVIIEEDSDESEDSFRSLEGDSFIEEGVIPNDSGSISTHPEVDVQSKEWKNIDEKIEGLRRKEITVNGKPLARESHLLVYSTYDNFIQAQKVLAKRMEEKNKEDILKNIENDVSNALDINVKWFGLVSREGIDTNAAENDQFFTEFAKMYKELAEKETDPSLRDKFNQVVDLIEQKRLAYEKSILWEDSDSKYYSADSINTRDDEGTSSGEGVDSSSESDGSGSWPIGL